MLWLSLILFAPSFAGDVPVEELVKLRAEIEQLSHDLDIEKESLRGRLRSMEAVRTDLEVQIQAEELALRTLQSELDELREAGLAEDTSREDLLPALQRGVELLTANVNNGLPYRVPERTAAIDEIFEQFQSGTLSAQRAASRMWQLAEDELRLTRENAVDRQIIDLDGKELLVDVARLGTVALYVRTPDARYGFAKRTDGGWTYTLVDDRTSSQQIASLFDAIEKQIRVGYFELPNALEGES